MRGKALPPDLEERMFWGSARSPSRRVIHRRYGPARTVHGLADALGCRSPMGGLRCLFQLSRGRLGSLACRIGRLRQYVRDVYLLNLKGAACPHPTEAIRVKTIYAFSNPTSVASSAGAYRRMSCPSPARAARTIIIDSESLPSVTERYLRTYVREPTLTAAPDGMLSRRSGSG